MAKTKLTAMEKRAAKAAPKQKPKAKPKKSIGKSKTPAPKAVPSIKQTEMDNNDGGALKPTTPNQSTDHKRNLGGDLATAPPNIFDSSTWSSLNSSFNDMIDEDRNKRLKKEAAETARSSADREIEFSAKVLDTGVVQQLGGTSREGAPHSSDLPPVSNDQAEALASGSDGSGHDFGSPDSSSVISIPPHGLAARFMEFESNLQANERAWDRTEESPENDSCLDSAAKPTEASTAETTEPLPSPEALFHVQRAKNMERLEQLFQWPEVDVSLVAASSMKSMQNTDFEQSDPAPYFDHLANIIHGCTISTSYSGVDTPATAMAMLFLGTNKLSGKAPPTDLEHLRQNNLFGVEFSTSCQAELLRHPFGPSCLFSNLVDFFGESLAVKIPVLVESRRLVDVVLHIINSNESATNLRHTCHCLRHDAQCDVS